MADKNKKKQSRLQRRKYSVRKSVFGSPERPRLSVFRSDKHIYAQIIDDYAGQTLAAASSVVGGSARAELKNGGNIAAAKKVGQAIAERAKAAGDLGGLLRPRRAAVSWPGQGAGGCGARGWIEILERANYG